MAAALLTTVHNAMAELLRMRSGSVARGAGQACPQQRATPGAPGSCFRLEDEVERCLGCTAELREARLLKDHAQSALTGLRTNAESNLL
jgi:hypothetical protein